MTDELTADCPHCSWSERIEPYYNDVQQRLEERQELHQRRFHKDTHTIQVTLERRVKIHQADDAQDYRDHVLEKWQDKDTDGWSVAHVRSEKTKDARGEIEDDS